MQIYFHSRLCSYFKGANISGGHCIYIGLYYIYTCCEKVFAPFLFLFLFFAYLSHLKDSDHQTNFNITQR